MTVEPSHPRRAELLGLQADYSRARSQCDQLKAVMPDRAESLERQFLAVKEELNRQAEMIVFA